MGSLCSRGTFSILDREMKTHFLLVPDSSAQPWLITFVSAFVSASIAQLVVTIKDQNAIFLLVNITKVSEAEQSLRHQRPACRRVIGRRLDPRILSSA